ncbi:MAG: hypothetical protein JW955_12500 [Sedimentisphaerales bacterium]|nr:hypothetical protein [Sedimentisphaerales bacterium]
MKLADARDVVNEELTRGFGEVCPECGASMVETGRRMEDGAVFIWYECTREDCNGQWLTKKAPRMRAM